MRRRMLTLPVFSPTTPPGSLQANQPLTHRCGSLQIHYGLSSSLTRIRLGNTGEAAKPDRVLIRCIPGLR